MRLVAFRGSVCTPSRGSQKVAPDSDLPIVVLSHGYGATATAMDPTVARLLDPNPAPVRDTLAQVIRLGS